MLILLAASLFFSSLSIARFALRRHFSQPKKKAAQPHGCAAARTTRRIPDSKGRGLKAPSRIPESGGNANLAHSSGMKKSSEPLSEPSSGR